MAPPPISVQKAPSAQVAPALIATANASRIRKRRAGPGTASARRPQRWTHWPWALRYHWPDEMRGKSWPSNMRAPATSAVVPASDALRA